MTKDLATALSDDPYIISTIGWTRPGTSSTANTNSIGVYGADGLTFNGYVDVVGVPGTNTIQLRWAYNVSNTGHYDITVYYIKIS